MKKFLLSFAVAALMFAGCQKNDVMDIKTPKGDLPMAFGVSQNVTSRGVTMNDLKQFQEQFDFGSNDAIRILGVKTTNGERYFAQKDGQTNPANYLPMNLKYSSASRAWTYRNNGTEIANDPAIDIFYWPSVEYGSLDFYAWGNAHHANGDDYDPDYIGYDVGPDATYAHGHTHAIWSDYEPGEDVVTQKDFVVASALAQTKAMTAAKNGTLQLTFKHALTKINFRGRIGQANLDVKVKEIGVYNVANKAEIQVSAQNATPLVYPKERDGNSYNYILNTGEIDLEQNKDVRITNNVAGNTIEKAANESFLMIPQTFGAAVPGKWNTGGLIRVLAQIKSGDTYIVGTADTYGSVYIPISSAGSSPGFWAPGRAIDYVITFGSSSMGNAFDPDGTPTWLPISIDATLADWDEKGSVEFEPSVGVDNWVNTQDDMNGYITSVNTKAIEYKGTPIMVDDKITLTGKMESDVNKAMVKAFTDDVANAGKDFMFEIVYKNLAFAKMRIGSSITFDASGVDFGTAAPYDEIHLDYLVNDAVNHLADYQAATGFRWYEGEDPMTGVPCSAVLNKDRKVITLVRVGWVPFNYETLLNIFKDGRKMGDSDIYYFDGTPGYVENVSKGGALVSQRIFDFNTAFGGATQVETDAIVKCGVKNVIGVTFITGCNERGSWTWNPITNIATFTYTAPKWNTVAEIKAANKNGQSFCYKHTVDGTVTGALEAFDKDFATATPDPRTEPTVDLATLFDMTGSALPAGASITVKINMEQTRFGGHYIASAAPTYKNVTGVVKFIEGNGWTWDWTTNTATYTK